VKLQLGSADIHIYRTLASLGLLIFTYSILSIELTISWNRISGVYDISSTGQIIPLVIGLGLLMSVTWRLVRKKEVGS
jgi:hypothetical protein